jgi:uncharacterized protein (TIGR02246 family)
MKQLVVLASALALGWVVPAIAQTASEADAQSAGESVLAAWNRTALAKDAAAHAALYTEDAIQVTPFGLVSGRPAIEKNLEAAFKNWTPNPSTLETVSMLAPNVMVRAGTWNATVTMPTGPTPVHGYWSDVDVRDGEGWKIRQETWNLVPPPPPGQAPK